jgi:hypothetical protein
MNTGTVVIGLVFIVIGIFTVWLFCLGLIFILVGFIIMIVGLVQSDKPKTVVHYYGVPPPGAPGYGPQQMPRYPTGPPGATNFCSYCGRQLAPGAVYCPGCGRKLA